MRAIGSPEGEALQPCDCERGQRALEAIVLVICRVTMLHVPVQRGGCAPKWDEVQGYLTHKKTHSPRTL